VLGPKEAERIIEAGQGKKSERKWKGKAIETDLRKKESES